MTGLTLLIAVATAGAPGTECSVPVSSVSRTYYIHESTASAPAPDRTGKATTKWPVVFIFHAFASDPDQMAQATFFNEKADAEGFIAVYPKGTAVEDFLRWRAGGCCPPQQKSAPIDLSDVDFFFKMLGDINSHLTPKKEIDGSRVFIAGMSNGGMLCHLIASDPRAAGKVAGIATVAGTIAGDPASWFSPMAKPIPLMHIHGTCDPVIPYSSTIVSTSGCPAVTSGQSCNALDLIDAWKKLNKSDPSKYTKVSVPTSPAAGAVADVREEWLPLSGGAPVVFYTVTDGGHTWPGGDRTIQSKVYPAPTGLISLGKISDNFKATDVIWDFFKKQ